MTDHLAWFSAGAASATATALTVREDSDTRVIYCDPRAEHPDNVRFREQVQDWLNVEIEVMASEHYHDPSDVWRRTGWIVGEGGARCTVELKKRLRQQVEKEYLRDEGKIPRQVFGYTAEEANRVGRFRAANPEVDLHVPLVDMLLKKSDCLGTLDNVGIRKPAMYELGYHNANCIGCPHGGMGYWNKIRQDFPDTFQAMAELERELDNACCRPGGEPVFLDELHPDRGDRSAPSADCSLLCPALDPY